MKILKINDHGPVHLGFIEFTNAIWVLSATNMAGQQSRQIGSIRCVRLLRGSPVPGFCVLCPKQMAILHQGDVCLRNAPLYLDQIFCNPLFDGFSTL